jgi:tRNA threonylcarbamoyl adenosine modification protein (Sua5/YciO/YrdC/YwlC family)
VSNYGSGGKPPVGLPVPGPLDRSERPAYTAPSGTVAMQLVINPNNPEPRKIQQALDVMRSGGVVAYPTDTVYGLGCDITDKKAMEKVYRMKRMDKSQLLSFVCHDLAQLAKYGVVEDPVYRLLRRLVPGPYTFILKATREVPKVLRLERKTVGIRVPNHPVALALARELGSPVASTSASFEGQILVDPADMEEHLVGLDMVLDGGVIGTEPSTVIDFSGDEPLLVRQGVGVVDFL